MNYKYRPLHFGVLQRIEYLYHNRERLLAPKLDGAKKFGTYGLIEITVIFYYPTIPGKLYHPVYNAEEASWWLQFYNHYSGEVKKAVFVPAPDQHETMLPFVIPDLGEVELHEETDDWYKRVYEWDEYTR
jgi:hypothetical protein